MDKHDTTERLDETHALTVPAGAVQVEAVYVDAWRAEPTLLVREEEQHAWWTNTTLRREARRDACSYGPSRRRPGRGCVCRRLASRTDTTSERGRAARLVDKHDTTERLDETHALTVPAGAVQVEAVYVDAWRAEPTLLVREEEQHAWWTNTTLRRGSTRRVLLRSQPAPSR